MKKVAVVYWSGTGNTADMANAVEAGAQAAGAEVSNMMVSEFSEDMVAQYDAFAFGCPAMGAEELEEDEFKPVFEACMPKLKGKAVALFGSYGWGGGEWMKVWEQMCAGKGLALAAESVICEGAPDDAAKDKLSALGAALAK